MKTNPAPAVVLPEEPRGPLQSWARFWFSPADPFSLHLVRVLTGLLLLLWLVPLAGQAQPLFGLQGWFDRQAYAEAARMDATTVPKPMGWSLLYLAGNNAGLVQAIYWASVAVLVLFTLGVGTRLTAVGAWLAVVSFTATPLFDEEVDPLLHMLTLYLAVGYLLLGQWDGKLTWLERIFGPRDTVLFGLLRRKDEPRRPSVGANVAMRLLQVHFAIMIVTTGLAKL